MVRTKVEVQNLKFGMYVAELDRPWTETTFVFQGFVLKTDQQLEALKRYCKFVYVDEERSESGGESERRLPATPLPGIRRVTHAERVGPEVELPKARDAFTSSVAVWQGTMGSFKAEGVIDATEVKGAVKRMTESMLRNPDALVLFSTLEERGGYFLTRAMNASIYMIMFARFLGMEQTDIELAGMVGLLQDIAMVQVPQVMVERKGPLAPEEVAVVRSHVEKGIEILKATPGLPPEVATLAAFHHERYDGSGYPRGVKGSALGTIGAMTGIVDTYGAMTSARPYADAITPSNALGMLHKWRGRAFHPLLIEEFIRAIGVFPVGSVVELNSGEVGIVISQNAAKRLQPRVMVVRDTAGNPLRPQKLLDLSRSPKLSAEETYRIRRTLEYGRSGVSIKDALS